MKHTLLASTALVALSSTAFAEVTVSGSARIGLMTTEGSALTAADTTMAISSADVAFARALDNLALYSVYGDAGTTAANLDADIVAIAAVTTAERAVYANLRALVSNVATGTGNAHNAGTAAVLAPTEAERLKAVTDLASLDAVIARMDATTSAAVAATSDTTVTKNRMRVKFAASGETDGGLAFGGSFKAHESGGASSGTHGSQYISGAFGKITMGDLDGADEQTVGNLSGVGFAGAGSTELSTYQSSSHDLGYSVSMSGVTFAASTDLARGADSTKTGSNSALGLKWSGDMGGATVGIGVGQSKVGVKTQDSMSASVSMGGLSIKVVTHTNDNGPAVVASGTSSSTTSGTAHVAATVAAADNNDVDQTGISLSYSMDSMTVTAFTRTESSNGIADKDYSGVGFAYDLGGASVKAGFVDANDTSVMDFGVTFSF
jgi:outer membrane protein OmpU